MKIKILSSFVLAVIVLSFAGLVFAVESPGSQSIEIPNPLKVISISALIERLLKYFTTIATILLPMAVIYAAYLFMTSGGEPDKVTSARNTILYTVIGYVLILISTGVAMIVTDILGGKQN